MLYPKSSFSPATPIFQKRIVKNGNDLNHDTASSANPCLVTDTVPHVLFEHNEICVFITKAQKQKFPTPAFLWEHSGIDGDVLITQLSTKAGSLFNSSNLCSQSYSAAALNTQFILAY